MLFSKDHIAAVLLSKLMTLLLWLITPVRTCFIKQWPHITVYTAIYHYRTRRSMTFAPVSTIILSPSANIICIGTFFTWMSFSVCLTVFIHCLAIAVIYVICSYERLMHILLNYCRFLDIDRIRSLVLHIEIEKMTTIRRKTQTHKFTQNIKI